MGSSLAHAPPPPKCRQNWLSSYCVIRLTNKRTNVVENVTCLARVIMRSVARFLCNGQTSRFCRHVDGLNFMLRLTMRPGNRYVVSSGIRFCVFTCSILCLTCPASASGHNNTATLPTCDILHCVESVHCHQPAQSMQYRLSMFITMLVQCRTAG